ncbi:hypothetical protein R3I94_013842 [Phoxinus phoxinus]
MFFLAANTLWEVIHIFRYLTDALGFKTQRKPPGPSSVAVTYRKKIAQDFEIWGHASQQIISYRKTEKRALDLPVQTNISSDTLGDVALKTLPAILPPLPFKTGCKMVRPSYQEAKQAFVDL